jgi:hypothetical protein
MSARKPAGGFWSRLNPRERVLILVLVVVFFVMGTAVLFVVRATYLGTTRDQIATTKRALDLVYTHGAVYQDQLQRKQDRESKISAESLLFATLIERASGSLEDLAVTNQEEKPPVDIGDGLRLRTVEFDLRSVTLEMLTRFLATLESEAGHVIFTQRLLVRSPSAQEDRLNAAVELATWERVAPEPEAATAEGTP